MLGPGCNMSGFLPNTNTLPLSPASVTDASVSPSATLIDATVAVPTNITFQPGVSASGQGIYKTWAEVMAVVAEVSSPLTINISFTGLGTAVITIPSGVYDMKHATLEMSEKRGFTSVNYVKLAPGAQLKNLDTISGPFTLLSQETTAGFPSLDWDVPPSPYGNLIYFTIRNDAFISSTGTQPFIIVDPAKYLLLIQFAAGGLWVDSGSGSFLAHVLHGGAVEFDFNAAGPGFNGTNMVDSADSTATLYISGDNSGPSSPAVFTSYTGSVTWLVLDGRATPFANRPKSGFIQKGASILDTTIGRPFWWNGTTWASDQPTISTTLSIWISNSLGNDSNNGTTSGTPLKTFAEFINRYSVSPIINNGAILTITFLDATVSEPINFEPQIFTNSKVYWNGTATVVTSNSTMTVNQQLTPASNLSLEISPGINLDGYVGAALFTNTTLGASAWIAKIVTAGTRYRLSPLIAYDQSNASIIAGITISTPANGNAWTVSTLTQFTGGISLRAHGPGISGPANGLIINNCDFTSPSTVIGNFSGDSADLILINSRIGTPVQGSFIQGRVYAVNPCIPATSGQVYTGFIGAASPQFFGGLSLATLSFTKPSNLTIQLWHLLQGVSINMNCPGAGIAIYRIQVQDWVNALISIDGGGSVLVYNFAPAISGLSATASTYIFQIKSGIVTLQGGGTWETAITARGADTATYDFKLNGNTVGSPYVPGSGVTVGEVAYTFVKLDTAAGAGTGFGGSASRADAWASITFSK